MRATFPCRTERHLLPVLIAGSLLMAAIAGYSGKAQPGSLRDPSGTHLSNVRQLTFGGENAEAYFSHDGLRLTFQSQRDGHECDQQYVMGIDGSDVQRISTGTGRTTCGWWMKGDRRILFRRRTAPMRTARRNRTTPEDMCGRYIRPTNAYSVKPDGYRSEALFPRTLKQGEQPGYNAESVVSPDGSKIVFTSDRGGDLDIWVMDSDGTRPKQLTRILGYDGGPWWSPDGSEDLL